MVLFIARQKNTSNTLNLLWRFYTMRELPWGCRSVPFRPKDLFFGHVILSSHLRIASHKTHAIKELKASSGISRLKSFNGHWNSFIRFVPSFDGIESPLYENLQAEQPFNFAQKEKPLDKMKKLQDKLSFFLELASPYAEGPLKLDVDAATFKSDVYYPAVSQCAQTTKHFGGYRIFWTASEEPRNLVCVHLN